MTTSKILVRLSRRLYWAEREALRSFMNNTIKPQKWRYFQADEGPTVLVESTEGTRSLFSKVQKILGEEFTNVYVRAVKTVREAEPIPMINLTDVGYVDDIDDWYDAAFLDTSVNRNNWRDIRMWVTK